MPALPLSSAVGPRRALLVSVVGVVVVAAALHLWWPAGVVLGLALGLVVVLALAAQQERAARAVPLEDALVVFTAEPHRVQQATAVAAVAAPAPIRPAAQAAIERPAPAPVAQTVAAAPVAVAQPVAPAPATVVSAPLEQERGVRADLDRLKADLGDDWPDFARAARLVVSTQYASAARLQRDLQLPYSRARRLLADLESEHFVGPATGTLPRQVLMPKERLPEVERLFAGV